MYIAHRWIVFDVNHILICMSVRCSRFTIWVSFSRFIFIQNFPYTLMDRALLLLYAFRSLNVFNFDFIHLRHCFSSNHLFSVRFERERRALYELHSISLFSVFCISFFFLQKWNKQNSKYTYFWSFSLLFSFSHINLESGRWLLVFFS